MLMSALGHKQTFAAQNVMSALPPIADMCSALVHVRFVPIADISFAVFKLMTRSNLVGLFHTQIARVGALQHSIYNASWSLWTRP